VGVEGRLAETDFSIPSASSRCLLSTDSSPVDGSELRFEDIFPVLITKLSSVELGIFDEDGFFGGEVERLPAFGYPALIFSAKSVQVDFVGDLKTLELGS
jgi:hypothetical protein